jgi:hypothetical protein
MKYAVTLAVGSRYRYPQLVSGEYGERTRARGREGGSGRDARRDGAASATSKVRKNAAGRHKVCEVRSSTTNARDRPEASRTNLIVGQRVVRIGG